jgi:anti-anti-sigma factor
LGSRLKWPLQITSDRRDSVNVLTLTGRLSQNAAENLNRALARAIDAGDTRIVVDLAGVDYLSSAALSALDLAAARCTSLGGCLALCSLTPPVQVSFEIAGVEGRIPIESTLSAAIERSKRDSG